MEVIPTNRAWTYRTHDVIDRRDSLGQLLDGDDNQWWNSGLLLVLVGMVQNNFSGVVPPSRKQRHAGKSRLRNYSCRCVNSESSGPSHNLEHAHLIRQAAGGWVDLTTHVRHVPFISSLGLCARVTRVFISSWQRNQQELCSQLDIQLDSLLSHFLYHNQFDPASSGAKNTLGNTSRRQSSLTGMYHIVSSPSSRGEQFDLWNRSTHIWWLQGNCHVLLHVRDYSDRLAWAKGGGRAWTAQWFGAFPLVGCSNKDTGTSELETLCTLPPEI